MSLLFVKTGAKQKKRAIKTRLKIPGRLMGLEPTTLGTTNRCSNQLSYNLRIELECKIMHFLYSSKQKPHIFLNIYKKNSTQIYINPYLPDNMRIYNFFLKKSTLILGHKF